MMLRKRREEKRRGVKRKCVKSRKREKQWNGGKAKGQDENSIKRDEGNSSDREIIIKKIKDKKEERVEIYEEKKINKKRKEKKEIMKKISNIVNKKATKLYNLQGNKGKKRGKVNLNQYDFETNRLQNEVNNKGEFRYNPLSTRIPVPSPSSVKHLVLNAPYSLKTPTPR